MVSYSDENPQYAVELYSVNTLILRSRGLIFVEVPGSQIERDHFFKFCTRAALGRAGLFTKDLG